MKIQELINQLEAVRDATAEDQDLALAWIILEDLSERSDVPGWIGDRQDLATIDMAKEIAQLIAQHRGLCLANAQSGGEK